ncbi:MAG: YXWGXW repeat-containing protein [Candidatus Omnitrophica bacterium]|nr:YXWGXW repeat-containing protein [Candidatus Omnitrophota bacterium]
MTVLTQGPVHEAFAGSVEMDPTEGLIVPKAPPPPIEEIPPEERPEGEDVIWIPGYWGWDPERQDFIWVSGVWRVPPPGQSWVPGYWLEVQGGYQWIPGFWVAEQGEEVEYLPPPPPTLEVGPSSPPPAQDYVWSPGSWVWYGGNYVWRPGYWLAVPDGWVWVPPHYEWTPSGYVFINGYWDFVLENRGVLFAPVAFSAPVYVEPAFVYCPAVVILADVLVSHLFFHPHYHHYCFGDYYDPFYADRWGIVPWFEFHYHHHHHGYDPLFACYSVHYHHHHGGHWVDHLRNDFIRRRSRKEFRPPKTYEARGLPEDKLKLADAKKDFGLASPLDKVTKEGLGGLKFQKVDPDRRNKFKSQGKDLRDIGGKRAKVETEAIGQSPLKDKGKGPQKLKLPKTEVSKWTGGAKKDSPPLPKEPTGKGGQSYKVLDQTAPIGGKGTGAGVRGGKKGSAENLQTPGDKGGASVQGQKQRSTRRRGEGKGQSKITTPTDVQGQGEPQVEPKGSTGPGPWGTQRKIQGGASGKGQGAVEPIEVQGQGKGQGGAGKSSIRQRRLSNQQDQGSLQSQSPMSFQGQSMIQPQGQKGVQLQGNWQRQFSPSGKGGGQFQYQYRGSGRGISLPPTSGNFQPKMTPDQPIFSPSPQGAINGIPPGGSGSPGGGFGGSGGGKGSGRK